MTIGIYQILNIKNDKRYIGQSVNIEARLSTHKSQLRKNKHRNPYLQKAFNKEGSNSFLFSTLIECSRDNLDFYEDHLIYGHKSNESEFGYNLRKVSTSNAGIVTSRSKHKSGDTYYRLTLLEPSFIAGDGGSWFCRCICGNTIKIKPKDIIRGHTKSCGCWNKEQQLKRHERFPGEQFNRWTLLDKIENRKGCAWWLAKCTCGTIKEVNLKYLLNGESKSCGCLRREVTTLRNYNRS